MQMVRFSEGMTLGEFVAANGQGFNLWLGDERKRKIRSVS
jgi:hypothetical protein